MANKYDDSVFAIPDDQKIRGISYGVIPVEERQLLVIVDALELLVASYPIPRDVRARVEGKLLPRLREIKDNASVMGHARPTLGIELSVVNRDDISYALSSSVIGRQLQDRGHDVGAIKGLLSSSTFVPRV